MNIFIKYFFILSTIFIFILWFQNIDDKKCKRTRNTFYEKYKLPILVCSLIGLFFNLSCSNLIIYKNSNKCFNKDKQDIYIGMPNF